MGELTTLSYARTGRIARITLNRPDRGNAITFQTPRELSRCVERADLDPEVHVIALAGAGAGFCAGYDLLESAQSGMSDAMGDSSQAPGSPLDPAVVAANHRADEVWDPMTDFAMMRRNVRGFMSLFDCDKPVVCKVHGYCVAGGTDLALCSDLLVVEDRAKIGYPPARVWGVPTTALWVYRMGAQRAKRLLFTGDCLSGSEAAEWGLALAAHPRDELDERVEVLMQRIARLPINQLMMMKRMANDALRAQGLHASQSLGILFDGVARHTREGLAFAERARSAGFKAAVAERDAPFGDRGRSTFKG